MDVDCNCPMISQWHLTPHTLNASGAKHPNTRSTSAHSICNRIRHWR